MSEFFDEAKKLAGEDPSLVDKGVQEAGQLAEQQTGGQFDSEIQGAEQQAEGYLGAGQDPQSGN